MDDLEQSKQSGTFTISPGKDIYGDLTLAGPNTSLYLRTFHGSDLCKYLKLQKNHTKKADFLALNQHF